MDKIVPVNLGVATVDAIANDNIREIGATMLDAMMVPVLDDTVLESIPVFGVPFKLFKTGLAIRDRILISTIGRFLFQLKDIPSVDRQKFVNKLNVDLGYKKRVGENVLLLLDKIDDVEKADLYGKLFQLHIKEEITYDEYRRFTTIISKAYVPDLSKLLTLSNKEHFLIADLSRDEQFALYAIGLCSMPFIESAIESVSCHITVLGKKMRTLLLTGSI